MSADDPPGRPTAPGHLSSESRALWGELLATYEFEAHELKTLRLALEALDRTSQARRALRRLGVTYDDRFGQPHARPEVALERESRRDFVRLMAALDLPADDQPQGQPRDRRGTFSRNPTGRARLEAV